ncbi:helix-turn-helix transcriptional regulator [Seohaeicola nanhaiensis]|uniref:Helix-turn-helix transcriptional regulator n=1 Tax=Seohaeicola nanhaiensis TaxID=1387282 RepID=A0ABV9KET6_9RHOB
MLRLSAYLRSVELTQAAFAAMVGVKQPTVHRWLKGDARPSWRVAEKIAHATGGAVPVSAWVSQAEEQAGSGRGEAA